jgi:hypothetical protein
MLYTVGKTARMCNAMCHGNQTLLLVCVLANGVLKKISRQRAKEGSKPCKSNLLCPKAFLLRNENACNKQLPRAPKNNVTCAFHILEHEKSPIGDLAGRQDWHKGRQAQGRAWRIMINLAPTTNWREGQRQGCAVTPFSIFCLTSGGTWGSLRQLMISNVVWPVHACNPDRPLRIIAPVGWGS